MQNKNSFIYPLIAGFCAWYLLRSKPKKTPILIVGDYVPNPFEYVPRFFTDLEYFGSNVIPNDYYENWLKIAQSLDKIREGFALPILIKKGFNIKESKFATCEAVEIFPQNNNVERLMEVIEFLKLELNLKVIEQKENKNIYLEL